MGMYAVQSADTGELAALRNAARDSRAVAMERRRALSAGQSGLAPSHERVRSGSRQAELPQPEAAAPQPAPAVPPGGAVAASAHLGRALSMQRRRQLSQGKGALNGAGGAPSATESTTPLNGATPRAPLVTPGAAAGRLGRDLSMQRRRQLSQGKGALPGGAAARAPAPAPGGQDAQPVAGGAAAAAQLGRALSMQRRRQLSQGKGALNAASAQPGPGAASASGSAGAGAPAPPESNPVGRIPPRAQALARRAEASRFTGAAMGRPQREGRAAHAPKVLASPTFGGQRVTGLRIGRGVQVTGDEAGAALPVSGTQYVAADGSTPPPGAGPKVGLVRTSQGLVVSGTTVRNKVAITGDEFGEHLPITGEADQKLDDDLTPRRDDTYHPAQFPRQADPHGASAVGTRLGARLERAASSDSGPWRALEKTDGGLPVTGTAVGRSGRVTGNEAGACRPVTGDQYQGLSAYSSECGGAGGGTAPAAQLNRARLDPATGGKVTEAQTWRGQRVTGPNVEHQPNVTGAEPGVCRPVTGTPYEGPSSAFAWCEPEEGEYAAQRLDPRPHGVAVTGDVPMHAKAVTGTERGGRRNITGTPYYDDLRAAEAAVDDWASGSFPVAQARRLAGGDRADAATPEGTNAPPPPSSVPGRITGSFTYGEGKVTGNNEFLFRARPSREGKQPAVTGEGRTEGRTVTGSAWTAHERVTGTEGYIAARRNPSEGGGAPHGWAGAAKFRDRGTHEGPRQIVTGLSGWSAKAAARITLSGGAQG